MCKRIQEALENKHEGVIHKVQESVINEEQEREIEREGGEGGLGDGALSGAG